MRILEERLVPNVPAMARKDPRVMVLKVPTHEGGEVMVALDPGIECWL